MVVINEVTHKLDGGEDLTSVLELLCTLLTQLIAVHRQFSVPFDEAPEARKREDVIE